MIIPTIGRVVWFYPQGAADLAQKRQPHCALIAYVHSDSEINIAAFNQLGNTYSKQYVKLIQEGELTDGLQSFCCWMPYQQAQAARATQQQSAPSGGKR